MYGGKCQITGETMTFKKKNGELYSEVHHLIPLGESGSDSYANAIVISPLIHRMLHYADVSEIDLNHAIKNNTIGGVALDVFEEEPAKNNILFGLDNVLLTPHIAASTAEAQVIVAEMIANQFVDFFLKNKVSNSVI